MGRRIGWRCIRKVQRAAGCSGGSSWRVSYRNVGGSLLTVDGGGGVDGGCLRQPGGGIASVVSDVAVSVLGQTVAVVVEAVEVEGLAGEDVFTVTAGAVPIAVVGGDPIESVRETGWCWQVRVGR